MPKANYQRKLESNYQTTDPCYGHEEDSEDETQATNKFNNNNKEDRMTMMTEMGELIGAMKIMEITKNIQKTTNRKTMWTI